MLRATTANVVAVRAIPPATNTRALLPSSQRARSRSSAPVTAPKAMQDGRRAPASTVMMAPTAADDANTASRLANQASARIALSARRSAVSSSAGDVSRGDNPAADPSRPSDIKAATEPRAYGGAAVITPTNAAMAMTIATPETAVNVTAPQPDSRIASTEVTAAAVAASNTLGIPGAPGTARNPAIAPNAVAIRLRASPAIASRYTRYAITAASRARKPVDAARPAEAPVALVLNAFRTSTSAPTAVRQPAAAAPVSRVACRCCKWLHGRFAAPSVADTASATSS